MLLNIIKQTTSSYKILFCEIMNVCELRDTWIDDWIVVCFIVWLFVFIPKSHDKLLTNHRRHSKWNEHITYLSVCRCYICFNHTFCIEILLKVALSTIDQIKPMFYTWIMYMKGMWIIGQIFIYDFYTMKRSFFNLLFYLWSVIL